MTASILTKSQFKSFGPKPIKGYGKGAAIWAHVRYDDECGNGHNTFAITGSVRVPGVKDIVAGGCLHEDISAAFPELRPLIKWHLCSSDGPLYYIANTMYHAGDKDCHGRSAGEPCDWDWVVYFTGFPLGWRPGRHNDFVKWLSRQDGHKDFEVIRIDHDRERDTFGPKYTLGGSPDKWYQCPFDTEDEAMEFLAAMQLGYEVRSIPTKWSEGKPRDLDAARACAIWPDATDEDLTAPELRERLEARLPGLLEEFRHAVESLGFTY